MKKNKPNRYLKGGFRLREDGGFVRPAAARMSRRGFLGSVAAGVGAAAMAGSGIVRAHEPPPQEYVPCGQPHVSTLWAGKHINVGTVTVANDDENLYVEYATSGDWCITETHLFVTTSPTLEDMPTAKQGQPIPGHFPYKKKHDCVKSYMYTIPLADYVGDCDVPIYVVPHTSDVNLSMPYTLPLS